MIIVYRAIHENVNVKKNVKVTQSVSDESTCRPSGKQSLREDDNCLLQKLPGTPINRLPIMAKSVLDLFELYNLVIARGGLVDVINKKLWQEIIKGLHLPSSITSAAFTLRTQIINKRLPLSNLLIFLQIDRHNLNKT
ncbi:hypothetical protein NQ317_019125 [Molorchus minor]|uniref:ARID domain-containing protein n=1 Tax=Molorchus minor TaxID=1323400 RepID=A0ABQ9J2C5_9CUCU|nr:hypothetical protein NQ317_019125 [Molorchus minor]